MNIRSIAVGLLAASAFSLSATANVLPEGSFWNKDTAYVAPAPAVSDPVSLDGDELSFTSSWDFTLLFLDNFYGRRPTGFWLIFN